MRKIYSLMLIAAGLLIGTSLQAQTYTKSVANYDQLISAIEGTEQEVYNQNTVVNITLTDAIAFNINNYDRDAADVEGGSQEATRIFNASKGKVIEIVKGQTINLNLNGHDINSQALYVFAIYYGKLYITGNGTIQNNLHRYKTNGGATKQAEASVVLMCGTSEASCGAKRTYLSVGKGVTLNTDKAKAAIYVNQFAYGDKKTVKGTLLDWGSLKDGSNYAFGVYADIYGTAHGMRYGIQMSGNIKATGLTEEQKASEAVPTYYVHKGAIVSGDNYGAECCGIYIGGYAKLIMEGTAYGSTGVDIKSGKAEIKDAVIYSNYAGSDYKAPTGTGSGTDCAGSGIVIESRDNYAGEINVVITGDTKVTGKTGYAIDEKVNTNNEASTTKVKAVKVEGGTFEAGGKGAIKFDETTAETNGAIVLEGGNVEGTVKIEKADGTDVTETMKENILPENGVMTSTEQNGKTVITITTTEVPMTDENTVASIEDAYNQQTASAEHIFVKLETAGNFEIASNLTIDMLQAVTDQNVTLTVKEGVTLTAKEIQFGSAAQIVVEAGAKLLITGIRGFSGTSVNSIVLKADEKEQATFVIAPTVNSNKQPVATVDLYTFACKANTENRVWQRIATPLAVYSSITNNASTLNPELVEGATKFSTYMLYYDESKQEWTGIQSYSEMRPFICYEMDNTSKNGGITYSFTGNLQGNVADNIPLNYAGWNNMANSFTAPMHLKTLLEKIQAQSALDGSIYLWNIANQKYDVANLTKIMEDMEEKEDIPSLQSFIVKTPAAGTLDINYEQTIFNYAVNPSSYAAAPTRHIAMNNNVACLTLTAANGESDKLYLVESDEFTPNYENGADAEKFMNKGLNFYAAGDEMDYAMVATDNLEGTMLNIQTVNDINYTLTFSKVRGEMMLKDNMTNELIAITEGATYDFVAPANETIEGRFEMVASRTTPTNLQNAHVGANVMKTMQNGRLMIIKNGRCFDAMGATIK